MTLEQLQKLPSYEALKRNGLMDVNIIEYYSLPKGQRVAYFKSFKNVTDTLVDAPIQSYSEQGTQKCTSVSVASVRRMAMEMMDKDFKINGQTFNMKQMNWSFEFSTHKRSFGQCVRRRRWGALGAIEICNKRIKLSQWLIVNSDQ